MRILNIAGYKFVALTNLEALRTNLLSLCEDLLLKGTILLSPEGLNIFLAGSVENISSFKDHLQTDLQVSDINFRESFSETVPFKRLKIKLKKEIITLRQSDIVPLKKRGASISPTAFKKWLDDQHDLIVLDTRNDYEMRFGAFKNAINLKLNNFCEFPAATDKLERDKPIVMYCTGGIRCEKASLYLESQGFTEVYQLEGGILNYFSEVGGDHYEGECFVFDDRIALNPQLKSNGTKQCQICQGPVHQTAHTCA